MTVFETPADELPLIKRYGTRFRISFRMSAEIHERLIAVTRKNGRSVRDEIEYRLARSFVDDQVARNEQIARDLAETARELARLISVSRQRLPI